MLKVLFKLTFSILFINLFFNNYNKDIIFIGHSYGSPKIDDKKLDASLLKFLKKRGDNYKIIFGGDVLKNCKDIIEIKNFKRALKDIDYKIVLGNHDLCNEFLNSFSEKKIFINQYELIGENLLIYLNITTNINDVTETAKFVNETIKKVKAKNILLFNHQLIYSKSNYDNITNSRMYYKYGNKFFDKIEKNLINSNKNIFFFSGDIGAHTHNLFSFFKINKNIKYYAVGLGNNKNNKGIKISLNPKIKVDFIDLESYDLENPENYYYYDRKEKIVLFLKVIINIAFNSM